MEHICTICKIDRYHKTNESWERHEASNTHQVILLRTQNAEQAETIAKLREALKEVTQLAPERAENMYKAQKVAFRTLAETEQK